jgi:ectoine hydroxylase-related dioxygenase (phytanoyl-CoA dioxygenase family)
MDSEYPLSEEQIAQYQRDGHILLRGLCSPEEMEVWKPLIGTATGRYNKETRALEERDTYGKAFLQVSDLAKHDEKVRHFVYARRFAQVAARLARASGIRLYHDQALYKEAGGGATPWHQDQFYWPMDTPKTITMWMPLVDVPVEKGALTFASGSHRNGSVCPLEISDESNRVIQEIVDRENFPIAVEPMKAGDATFHSGWTLHRAPANQTGSLREVMTIIYYADGTRISGPQNKFQQADMEYCFPNLKPGDLAATEKNPLLYSEPE